MSMFCVFAVSKAACKALAEKSVTFYNGESNQCLTMHEWKVKVEEVTANLFRYSVKLRRASPAFDAPQFCREWIQLAEQQNEIILPLVMVRGKKLDKAGKVVKRNGKELMT